MRLILVDDHPLVRKGLISVLSLEKEFEVVGEAGNVREAVALINRLKPELALIDIRLGNESGLDILEKYNKDASCKYIVLTSSASGEEFKRAEEAGVQGFILKEALPEELIFAVRLVSRGRKYYDPGILDVLMSSNREDQITEELTPREIDVLIALGQGLNNKAIAKKLYITEYTVKKHVSQILAKLGLADRTQAALYAYEKGLVRVS